MEPGDVIEAVSTVARVAGVDSSRQYSRDMLMACIDFYGLQQRGSSSSAAHIYIC